MKFYPIFSGSSGNSSYIEFPSGEGILVDVGKSAKQIEKFFRENNIDMHKIKGIFITHEHSDHISALKVFSNRYNIKLYASKGTFEALKSKCMISEKDNCTVIFENKECDVGCASVIPFFISHDCKEGFGYVITSKEGKKAAICTDLGYVPEKVKCAVSGAQIVAIESNHDVMMLQNGPYPYYLKRRILSDSGHLSNESCSQLLPELVEKGAKKIILSHLSAHNNLPQLALETAVCSLNKHGMINNKDFSVSVAPRVNSENTFFTV